MSKSTLLKIGTPVVFLGLLSNQACKGTDQEVAPKDLILGEWLLTKIDGEKTPVFENYILTLTMEFFNGGLLDFCYNYDYPLTPENNYQDCPENSRWEWQSAEESILQMIIDGDTLVAGVEFPADSLMNWDVQFRDGETALFELVRVE